MYKDRFPKQELWDTFTNASVPKPERADKTGVCKTYVEPLQLVEANLIFQWIEKWRASYTVVANLFRKSFYFQVQD